MSDLEKVRFLIDRSDHYPASESGLIEQLFTISEKMLEAVGNLEERINSLEEKVHKAVAVAKEVR